MIVETHSCASQLRNISLLFRKYAQRCVSIKKYIIVIPKIRTAVRLN